jgi:hypothetical protein
VPERPVCQLVGEDGNVFNIIALVRRALREAGQMDAAEEFVRRAYACQSYEDVLALVVAYVDVE